MVMLLRCQTIGTPVTVASPRHCKWRRDFTWLRNLLASSACFSESLVYSAMVQGVQNPTAMQETQDSWAWSLGWEDPLEEERATHSSVLAWRVPGTEEPGGLQSMVSQTHQCIPSIIHSLLHPTLEECTDFLCFHEWILSVLVLVFYCCITNCYKSKSLKQHSLLSA